MAINHAPAMENPIHQDTNLRERIVKVAEQKEITPNGLIALLENCKFSIDPNKREEILRSQIIKYDVVTGDDGIQKIHTVYSVNGKFKTLTIAIENGKLRSGDQANVVFTYSKGSNGKTNETFDFVVGQFPSVGNQSPAGQERARILKEFNDQINAASTPAEQEKLRTERDVFLKNAPTQSKPEVSPTFNINDIVGAGETISKALKKFNEIK